MNDTSITMEQYNSMVDGHIRPMNPQIKAQWVSELRSGNWAQGWGRLAFKAEGQEQFKYCCLGVLCEIAVSTEVIGQGGIVGATLDEGGGDVVHGLAIEYGVNESAVLPIEVIRWSGTPDSNPYIAFGRDGCLLGLAELNDCGFTFDQIADMIERFL